MAALPSYVARSSKNVKRAFEIVFKAMVSVLGRSLVDKKGPNHARAQAIAALCVRGMVVARSVVDRAVADELRDACMAVALRLGGWDNATNSKKQPFSTWTLPRTRLVMNPARKITVEVPEELLEKAQEASGEGITQTVRTGLRLVAASRAYTRLRELRGKVKFSRTATDLKDDR